MDPHIAFLSAHSLFVPLIGNYNVCFVCQSIYVSQVR